MTRTSASIGMKLVSPIQRGTMCQCSGRRCRRRRAPEVHADIQAVGLQTSRSTRIVPRSVGGQRCERRRRQRREVAACAPRRHHEVPVGVGIAVEHHDRAGRCRQHERARGGRSVSRASQKMHPAPCGATDVRHAPGRPEDLHDVGAQLVAGRLAAGAAASAGDTACPSTRSLSSLPTLKNGTLFAATATSSPVFGLRPSRAWRCLTTKLPKPRISMRSPRHSASVMLSKTELTMTSASRREKRGRGGRSRRSGRAWSSPAALTRPRPFVRRAAVTGGRLVAVEPQLLPIMSSKEKRAPARSRLQVGSISSALRTAAQRPDAQGDLALPRVDLGHLGLELLPDLEERPRLVDAVAARAARRGSGPRRRPRSRRRRRSR